MKLTVSYLIQKPDEGNGWTAGWRRVIEIGRFREGLRESSFRRWKIGVIKVEIEYRPTYWR